MVIIILALLIMRVSFVTDLPPQTINLNTYLSQSSPLVVPISSSDPTLLTKIQNTLTSKYDALISVATDTTDSTSSTFDSGYLFS